MIEAEGPDYDAFVAALTAIAEKMCAEAEGIFLWCLEGLRRLIANNYSFTLSALDIVVLALIAILALIYAVTVIGDARYYSRIDPKKW